MFIYFGELQASGTLPLDVAFVVIGIVHDRVPRNNQRGNLAPDELEVRLELGRRMHAARSFERVPAAPRVARARSGDARRETYWDNINILMINTVPFLNP